jgi:hypothetical protein
MTDRSTEPPPPLSYEPPQTRPRRPWYRPTRGALVGGALLLAVGIACVVVPFLSWYLPFSARVERAEARAAALSAAVTNDPRFADVVFVSETHSGGGLGVWGYVASPGDLAALKNVVGGSTRQLPVFWQVKVIAAKVRPTTRKTGAGAPGV